MATLRCPGTRVQKPPYQWKTTNYHEWSWVNDQGEDVCAHCGKTRKEVTVPDSQLPKYPVEALAAVDSIAVTADSGFTRWFYYVNHTYVNKGALISIYCEPGVELEMECPQDGWVIGVLIHEHGSTLCYEGKKPVNLQPLKENYPNLQIKG
jgi:hypothetical protein